MRPASMPNASYSARTARAAAWTMALSPPMAAKRSSITWISPRRCPAGMRSNRANMSVPGGNWLRSKPPMLGSMAAACSGFSAIISMPATINSGRLSNASSCARVAVSTVWSA